MEEETPLLWQAGGSTVNSAISSQAMQVQWRQKQSDVLAGTLVSEGFFISSAEKIACWVRTSLVVQWLQLCLPRQELWVRSLVWELTFCMPLGTAKAGGNRKIDVLTYMPLSLGIDGDFEDSLNGCVKN